MMNNNLLNINKIGLEMVHLSANRCYRFVDPIISLFRVECNYDDNK